MNLGRLGRGEFLAVLGGLLLALGVFLPWYETNPDNRNANVDGATGSFSAFDAHPILRWLLLAAAAAPLILAWIIVRDHTLSWPRGQVTSIVAIAAFGLLFYNGLVDRPGDPSSQIELEWGWYVAVLGTVLMIAGSVRRQQEHGVARKPPGVA
jgi:hypothetical protein